MVESYKFNPGSASAFYEKMVTDRGPFEKRAEQCALLTIESLMMTDSIDGETGFSDLYNPFQSVGARGVKNLASKLLLALMPPSNPFFRLIIDEESKAKMIGENKDAVTEIEKSLGKMERIAQTDIETSSLRATAYEVLKHLINNGNALLDIPEDTPARMFSLKQYVCKRRHDGEVLQIVFKEEVDKESLTNNQKACLDANDLVPDKEAPEYGVKKDSVCVYTSIKRNKERWEVWQEIKGKEVDESRGFQPIDAPRFIALRWGKKDGEDYGRSFVEELIGDLSSLEGLAQGMTEASAILSKITILVNPNGVTDKRALEGNNGAIADGNAEDVGVVQIQKSIDLSFAKMWADAVEKRLELAFLLNTAVQRQAERVTAEEIRFIAQELEDTLGGVYSTLAQTFLTPVINRKLKILQKKGKLPPLPKDDVKVQIVAGLQALGRSHELTRLDAFVQNIAQTFGPEAVAKYVDVPGYLKSRATALGIDTDGLLKTEEEIKSIEEAEMNANMANSKVAPEIVKQLGGQQQPPAPAA